MSQALIPDAMEQYCRDVVPGVLHDVCEVDLERAGEIARDMLVRGEAFAALDQHAQDVLMGPFIEEVFAYEPVDAPVYLKAAVAIIVRNSHLEEVHADGHVNEGGIQAITSTALAPVSHLIAARRREPQPVNGPNPFHGLRETYPRAWACLEALTEAYAEGGRIGYRASKAPVPLLPTLDERVQTTAVTSGTGDRFFVQSGIEVRFDDQLVAQMEAAAQAPLALFLPTLSRASRNTAKMMRTLEFFLAHRATIVTTNFMLRAEDVWVRRGDLVQPDNSGEHTRGLHDLTGLGGAHRRMVQQLAARFDSK